MIDASFFEIIWVILTALCGMIAIGAGLVGYWYRKVHWLERIVAVIAGLMMMYPESLSDVIGIVIFAGLMALQIFYKNNKNQPASIKI